MKRGHLLIMIATLHWLLLSECSSLNALPKGITAQQAMPLLLFQKTPCLGTCPAYNAMVYEDGSIRFVEYKKALAQDTLQLQLAKKELKQLKEAMEELNYKDLQNNYLSGWSDISSTYLTFYEDGKQVKRVKHQKGGPQELLHFQEWLHELLWQRAHDKRRPAYLPIN